MVRYHLSMKLSDMFDQNAPHAFEANYIPNNTVKVDFKPIGQGHSKNKSTMTLVSPLVTAVTL